MKIDDIVAVAVDVVAVGFVEILGLQLVVDSSVVFVVAAHVFDADVVMQAAQCQRIVAAVVVAAAVGVSDLLSLWLLLDEVEEVSAMDV